MTVTHVCHFCLVVLLSSILLLLPAFPCTCDHCHDARETAIHSDCHHDFVAGDKHEVEKATSPHPIEPVAPVEHTCTAIKTPEAVLTSVKTSGPDPEPFLRVTPGSFVVVACALDDAHPGPIDPGTAPPLYLQHLSLRN